jgi:hypothetical protein
MDTSVIIIGIIIVSLVLLPIWLISTIISLKEKRLRKAFKELCIAHKLTIKEPELIKRKIIGIDADAKTFVYLSQQTENQDQIIVKLSEVSNCRVIRNTEKSNTLPHSQEETIQRVDLILTPSLTPQQEIFINFYNVKNDASYESYPMYDKAVEWQRNINKFVKVPEKVLVKK